MSRKRILNQGSNGLCLIFPLLFFAALGKDEGGSGVPLDRAKYEASCEYWENHAGIQ